MSQSSGVLLAMETSGDVCGVALTRDGVLVSEFRFRHEMHLSERIMEVIDALLQASGITLADVDAFAVGIGPGSFTGTRIGVMTMKTLASVQQKPIYGIDSLSALAAHYQGLHKQLIVPVLPCRPGIVFAAIYDVSKSVPVAFIAPDAFTLDDLRQAILDEEPLAVLFCGSAIARYRDELAQISEKFTVSFGILTEPSSATVAQLANVRYARAESPDDVFSLVPLYLAPPPISVSKTPIPTGNLDIGTNAGE